MKEVIEIDDTYTIEIDFKNGIFRALRHGEEWRDLVGDNLILAMAYKIQELQDKEFELIK